MKEVDMQKKEEVKEETKKIKEDNKEDFPEGFYLTEIPENYRRLIAFKDKEINIDMLIVKMANHLREQTGFKIEE